MHLISVNATAGEGEGGSDTIPVTQTPPGAVCERQRSLLRARARHSEGALIYAQQLYSLMMTCAWKTDIKLHLMAHCMEAEGHLGSLSLDSLEREQQDEISTHGIVLS